MATILEGENLSGSENTFLYQQYPLHEDQIRVLTLQPASSLGSPVDCNLEVTSLSKDRLQYEALSYTWGPAFEGQIQTDKNINLCGHTVIVTGNLFDGLKRLRLQEQPRRLWIDALCINQRDDDERSQQVSIMAQIYRTASRTLVWLGEDSDVQDGEVIISLVKDSDWSMKIDRLGRSEWPKEPKTKILLEQMFETKLLDTHSAYSETRDNHCGPDTADQSSRSSTHTSGLGFQYCANPAAAFVLDRIKRFHGRNYFKRRWTIQELYHAKTVDTYCGTMQTDWHNMESAIRRLTTALYTLLPYARPDFPVSFNVRADRLPYNYEDTVIGRMAMYESYRCSDPRDKLYSSLSLGAPSWTQPDYALSPSQVWIRLGRCGVGEGMTAYLITMAAHQTGQKKADDLPSWVPDFSLNEVRPNTTESFQRIPDINPLLDDQKHLTCTMECFGEIAFDGGDIMLASELDEVEMRRRKNVKGRNSPRTWNLLSIVSASSSLAVGDQVCTVYEADRYFFAIRPYADWEGLETFIIIAELFPNYDEQKPRRKPKATRRRIRMA